MKWTPIEKYEGVVVTNSGESFVPLASFQGSDEVKDLVKVHMIEDGDCICLLSEYEDPTGRRLVARTTQWPKEIIKHSLNRPTPAFFDAVDPVAPEAPEPEQQGGHPVTTLENTPPFPIVDNGGGNTPSSQMDPSSPSQKPEDDEPAFQ